MKTQVITPLARSFLIGKGESTRKGQRYLMGAVLGVAFSLIPLVLVIVVSDSMIESITARYIETGTYHLQAVTGRVLDAAGIEASLDALRAKPGVRAATHERQGPAIAFAGKRTTGALIRAVDEDFFRERGVARYLETLEGDYSGLRSRDAILGQALAKKLALKPGDSFGILTGQPQSQSDPQGSSPPILPKLSFFRVKAVVSAGYRELDSLWLFVTPEAGQRILAPESSRSFIGIKVDDPYGSSLDAMAAATGFALDSSPTVADQTAGAMPGPGRTWYVSTWKELEQGLFRSFATTKSLLMLVMALAVAVAAVNVASALSMLVVERRQDIAILKATGASSSLIGSVFITAGLFAGGIGTVIGITAGLLLSWKINEIIGIAEILVNAFSQLFAAPGAARIELLDPDFYLSTIPVQIEPTSILLIALLALVLCVLASFAPARNASRLSPLEITRKI